MWADWRRVGVVLMAVLVLSGVARADKAADHAMELKARENFAAGRYAEALDIFAKLYAETLHPVYLRNIGRCQQKLREPQKAIDAFQDYLAKEKKLSADERTEINGYIKEMEALRDEQARQAQTPPPNTGPPPGTGAPWVTPVPPAAGAAPNGPAWGPPVGPAPSATLVSAPVAAGAQPSTPIYKKWWFWTAIGVVAAGAVVAALTISGGTTRPNCPSYAQGCM